MHPDVLQAAPPPPPLPTTPLQQGPLTFVCSSRLSTSPPPPRRALTPEWTPTRAPLLRVSAPASRWTWHPPATGCSCWSHSRPGAVRGDGGGGGEGVGKGGAAARSCTIGSGSPMAVAPTSNRLQLLEPLKAWSGEGGVEGSGVFVGLCGEWRGGSMMGLGGGGWGLGFVKDRGLIVCT
jgi:hypothetical protein